MQITRRVFVSTIALAVAAALAACGKQQGMPQQTGPVQVGIVVVQPQQVALTSELAGRTSAFLVSDVRPQVGGIIQKRLFQEGSDVKAGQTLYQIDPASYKASYDSAVAALAKAEATLQSAKLKEGRYKELVAINAVGKQDYDDAFAALKQDEADVAADKAAVETARINLNYTRVTAPVSGRIGKSSVTPGALVTASQSTALATVQQLDPMYVDVTQSSAELLRLKQAIASGLVQKAGDTQARVKLTLEDGSPYPLEGKLEFSDVTVDQTSGAVTLRAVFPNPKHDLLPGMYVHAVLEQAQSSKGILVPQQGITRDNAGNAVAMLVGADGKVVSRSVKTDRAIGDKWLVSSGLVAGDKLIVEGLQRVRPGAVVNPVPASNVQAGSEASGAK
ncbi:efflux RND transporter periplasmic adaptor subunit [Paludibacterium yongneupense]|uniref:efflux RND transporter periplasmic adaptor subunit n=1 Tax=Paludibacterium yongneupense TaxID=400061 RepID=UPI0003FA8077|nr:efflux RND transporter periplasmic adaptor subunit [Paludibacterium yongneupense]